MRKPIRSWTEEETTLLLRRFILEGQPYANIAEELRRERWDVEKMAKKLRLFDMEFILNEGLILRLVRAAGKAARETGHCAVCGQEWTPSPEWASLHEKILVAIAPGSPRRERNE